jgi:transposase-like protein
MEREWLAQRLEAGRSIESIAREAGRSPSTIAYWANKHGLASQHASKHAARGGIERETLAALVADGHSTRGIAARLAVSQATVRYWLSKHGLVTKRAARRRLTGPGPGAQSDATQITAYCSRHGATEFRRRAEGGWRCLKCRAEAVIARRRRVKTTLVAEAGGSCALCGYSRTMAALQFHHLDRGTKEFHLAQRGVARAMSAARAEARKCILLCANCHAEVEAGLATIPQAAPDASPA